MNASDYQKQASRTLLSRPGFEIGLRAWVIIFNALALARATGAVVELVKKGIFHQHGFEDTTLLKRLKEVRAASCNFFGREETFAWWQITDREAMIVWAIIGLLGEAAEVADLILSNIGKGEIDQKAIAKELGDCLWYIAALCTKFNIDLGEVMEWNIAKLQERYPDGFNSEDSRARVDVEVTL